MPVRRGPRICGQSAAEPRAVITRSRLATLILKIVCESNDELNALRQRQVLRPVAGVGLPPHVGLPRIAAGFAAAAGLFLPAERAADLRAAGADVDVGDPAVAAAMAQEGFGGNQAGGEH